MFSRVTDHESEALARLPESLKDKSNFAALLGAVSGEIQTLEDLFYALYSDRLLETAVGAQLDVLGKIVGQERGSSADDAEYRLRIKARVKANKSSGSVKDILGVFLTLLGDLEGVRLEQLPPASFILHLEGEETSTTLAALYLDFLGDSKAAGVNAQLHTLTDTPEDTFTLAVTTFVSVAHTAADPSLIVESTEGFPDAGSIIADYDTGDEETLTYSSKTTTSFEGLSLSNFDHLVGALVKATDDSNKAFNSGYISTISQA
jgi:hypothetical protein